MIDQREGLLGETARARCERRIKEPFACSPCYRHHAHQREALIAYHVRTAHHHTRPRAMLFVTGYGVEFHQDYGASAESHSLPSTHPSPGTHRIASPALLSTSASVSSSGKLRVHASSPSSASSALSG